MTFCAISLSVIHIARGKALLAGMIVVHCGLLIHGAATHSPTFNEPAHLASGIHHWLTGRYDLYEVNPPLVRMVAAIPPMLFGIKADFPNMKQGPGVRWEFRAGESLVRVNGASIIEQMFYARLACIPFSILGMVVCYCWARQLFGEASGLFAAGLWAFSPDVLGHAALITPDIPAASLAISTMYLFFNWLLRPCWTEAISTGIVLGIAELAKFSLLLLLPVMAILFGVKLTHIVPFGRGRRALTASLQLACIILTSIYVVNTGYLFHGTCRRIDELRFVSALLGGDGANNDSPGNRMASRSFLGKIRIPFPENYLYGIDKQRRDFESGAYLSYLGGRFSKEGWWYYYLYAIAVKWPVGYLALFLLAVLCWGTSRADAVIVFAGLALFLPACLIISAASSQTSLNHHYRYIFPAFPFLFVAMGIVWRDLQVRRSATVLAFSWVCFLVSVAGALRAAPDTLAYFNELAGGPGNGHRHLLHSSLDWGQDLVTLRKFLDGGRGDEPLFLAYYGLFDPADIGFAYTLPPRGDATRVETVISSLEPGWYAISVNFLCGCPWSAFDGKGGTVFFDAGQLSYFAKMTPVAKCGLSIWIFKID